MGIRNASSTEPGILNVESQTVLGYLTSGDTKPDQQLEVTFIKHYSSILLCFYSIYVA